ARYSVMPEIDQSDGLAPANPDRGDDVRAGELPGDAPFDFDAHRQRALDAYEPRRQEFLECAQAVRSVVTSLLKEEDVLTQSLEARAKTAESFGRKSASPSESDPSAPKYEWPLDQITDL